MMSGLYSIPLAGLKEGRYTYDFEIGDSFFEAFVESEIKKGKMRADVVLERRSTHLELTITIKGSGEVICDRCLEPFSLPIACTNKLFVKQGKDWDEKDPDLITMPLDEHEIDLGQYFYEYIHLALPIQRIHPEDKKGNNACNPEMINRMKNYLVDGEKKTDPRWDKLKKLTDNN